jgi:hypothetical protein
MEMGPQGVAAEGAETQLRDRAREIEELKSQF